IMNQLKLKKLSLLCAAAMLASAPAFAQQVESNRGSGEAPRAAPGGPELAPEATPDDPPTVDADAIDRAAPAGDPAKLLESLGVVSRSKSGEETRRGPSEEV